MKTVEEIRREAMALSAGERAGLAHAASVHVQSDLRQQKNLPNMPCAGRIDHIAGAQPVLRPRWWAT